MLAHYITAGIEPELGVSVNDLCFESSSCNTIKVIFSTYKRICNIPRVLVDL